MYEDATLLASLFVQHFLQLVVDLPVDLGLYALMPLEEHAFSEIGAIDVAQEAERIAEVGSGVVEKIKMMALLGEEGIFGDTQSVEKDDALVVEESV